MVHMMYFKQFSNEVFSSYFSFFSNFSSFQSSSWSFLSIVLSIFFLYLKKQEIKKITSNELFWYIIFYCFLFFYIKSEFFFKILIWLFMFIITFFLFKSDIQTFKVFVNQHLYSFLCFALIINAIFDLQVFVLNIIGLLNISIADSNFYKTIKKNNAIIKWHWENDKDLINLFKINLIFFVILTFLFTGMFFCFKYNFTNYGIVSLNILNYFFPLFIIFNMVIELHIIFFRNPVVDHKFLQGCITCVKFIGGSIASIYLIQLQSSLIITEPTTITNFYDRRLGRGFGFDSMWSKKGFFLLQKKNNFDPLSLLNSDNNLCNTKLSDWIKNNQAELNSLDKIALGYNQEVKTDLTLFNKKIGSTSTKM